jgi:hypothetical protein
MSTTPPSAATVTSPGLSVQLTVIASAATSPAPPADHAGQVDIRLRYVRPGQVVDDGRVCTAERPEVHPFRVVDVHDDVADVAGDAEPSGHGRGIEGLAAGGAVELHRVSAGLAFDEVVAVARFQTRVSLPGPPSIWSFCC